VLGAATDNLRELTSEERGRIFNLGYFTWVEQQGVPVEDFVARRDQRFWADRRREWRRWDDLILELNERTAVLETW
jgi:hypothetical protein